MSVTLQRPKKQQKHTVPPHISHSPNYIVLSPPGIGLAEKMTEMGIDAAELARRMTIPVETVEKLLRTEIILTDFLARKIEKATGMSAAFMIKKETRYHEKLAYALQHPEFPAYLGDKNIHETR